MTLLEIQNKVQMRVKKEPFWKLLIVFGLIPSAVILSFTYVYSPNVDPLVRNSPLLMSFMLFALTITCFMFFLFGLVAFLIGIDGYLYIRTKTLDRLAKFNANSIIRDDYVSRKMAKQIFKYLVNLIEAKIISVIDEVKAGLEYQISELKKELQEKDKIFMDTYRKMSNEFAIERQARKKAENELEKERENKNRNTIPLEDFEKLSSRLLKVEEELKNLKGD
ncbi:MAG: hypothetical protein QW303_02655 [Nitrososphaerota archaeon]